MNVRLTQLDGKLPNLALMKLASWHRSRGDAVTFSKSLRRDMLEPEYSAVYGSAIFQHTVSRVHEFLSEFPNAIVGGTWNLANMTTVENVIGADHEHYDYSIYPGFSGSIGFTQRGCRLKCGFCVVPKKEGKNRGQATINDIWRGEPYPKHIHLLDNDFFGQPEWKARVGEITAGKFKVCFNQGINVRLINEEAAEALGSIPYYDDQFKTRRLYTAWDNLRDEKVFFRGVEMLERHGVQPTHLLVYMLVGYAPHETWDSVLYRFNRMVERGIRPYPMVYGDRLRTLPGKGFERLTLRDFQRWAIRKAYTFVPFKDYDRNAKGHVNKQQASLPLEAA